MVTVHALYPQVEKGHFPNVAADVPETPQPDAH